MYDIQTLEIFIADIDQERVRNDIWALLITLDREFIPPLSARESTVAMSLNGSQPQSVDVRGPIDYFAEILKQVVVLGKINDEIAGLIAFRHDYSLAPLIDIPQCNYITTVGVMPKYRNIGVARSIYRYMLNDLPDKWDNPIWVTRTWQTNADHIHLLRSLAFGCEKVLVNHRGPGMDTLYFVRRVTSGGD